VSVESLWSERVAQNVPGTTDAERPNWRQRLRRAPAEALAEPAVATALAALVAARRTAEIARKNQRGRGRLGTQRRPAEEECSSMAYVVADPCIKCKYTDCVAVCPVECFYEGKNSLVIHPDECIDCGACEPECPTTAIFEESALPDKWKLYKDV